MMPGVSLQEFAQLRQELLNELHRHQDASSYVVPDAFMLRCTAGGNAREWVSTPTNYDGVRAVMMELLNPPVEQRHQLIIYCKGQDMEINNQDQLFHYLRETRNISGEPGLVELRLWRRNQIDNYRQRIQSRTPSDTHSRSPATGNSPPHGSSTSVHSAPANLATLPPNAPAPVSLTHSNVATLGVAVPTAAGVFAPIGDAVTVVSSQQETNSSTISALSTNSGANQSSERSG